MQHTTPVRVSLNVLPHSALMTLDTEVGSGLPLDRSAKLAGDNPFATQAKMLWHLDRLMQWKLTGDTFPVQMEVNLTNHCNEACRWCISAYSHLSNPAMTKEERERQLGRLQENPAFASHPERRRGLELGHLRTFLREAKDSGLKSVAWSGGGEPTTHPQFTEAVRSAAELRLQQGLMTNGLYPPSYVPVIGNNLRWLRVSLDTLDARKYEYHKQTKGFPSVIQNIKELVSYPVKVGINMNLAAWNVDEVLSMAEWSRDVGAAYFQIRPILGLPFEMKNNGPYRKQPEIDWLRKVKPLLLEAERIRTDKFQVCVSWDKFKDLEEETFGRTYTKCLYHFFFCVLNADGDLCVCMYHLGDRRFSFGNIYEDSLGRIWRSEKREQVIRMCADNLDLSTCQVCCKGHEINKFLHLVENPDASTDINFL
jgi:MoaA/NifB/PqqE/SkfB family radical SAM enzyme